MVSEKSLKNTPVSVILSGPTATGKTAIALEFARKKPDIEIINADSLLIFREMNIGTAKPTHTELQEVKHHLIDVMNPGETFTAGDYVRRVEEALADIHSRGKRALLVGGSGFYLKALIYGLWEGAPADPAVRSELEKSSSPELYENLYKLDEQSALRIGVNDRYRLVRAMELYRLTGKTPSQLQSEQNRTPDPSLKLMVIDRSNESLFPRIGQRSKQMIADGLIDEVKALRSEFPASRALSAVGYAQVCDFLDSILPPGRKLEPGNDGLIAEIELATRQLVKRQRTWFKSEKSAKHFELERDRTILLSELGSYYA